jgi:hypothetical protein
VIERREKTRFALESRHPLTVLSESRREDLDGDLASEPGVPCSVDLAHSPGAEHRKDFVRTEARTD